MNRRSLGELLARARAQLAADPTITAYEMLGDRPVTVLAWCPACRAPRGCDVLTNKHTAVPDFQICTRCGNGVAVDELAVAA